MLKGHEYIKQTRAYLDYLEEHFNNIEKAFHEVTKACQGMEVIADDKAYFDLKHEVIYHDISKFSMEEFTQYRAKWFSVEEELHDSQLIDINFDKAWKHHYLNNTHHTESIRDDSELPGVTERDLIHMVIDWTAMGYKFDDTAQSYYEKNYEKIGLQQSHINFINEIFTHIRNNK